MEEAVEEVARERGPARFLAPREPECLIGHVSSEPAACQAALAVAKGVLSLLPIPKLHTAASPLLIPAFERIPASGDLVHTVDRVVAVPFSGQVMNREILMNNERFSARMNNSYS